jgi:hypothetical protein
MPTFEDPITDQKYDTGDPMGLAKQALMIVLGIGMTVTLFQVAQATVVPVFGDLFSVIPGVDTGDAGSGVIQFGDP